MTRTIAVFGAGPGLGRAVAHRFGRAGFRVALIARNRQRLDAFAADLGAVGVEASGFAADLGDTAALPELTAAITRRFGGVDVVHYAPSGTEWITRQVAARAAGPLDFDFALDLLLRVPAVLVQHLLPAMLRRGDGAILFGLPVTASVPVPQLSNIGAGAAAARSYLHNLHHDLDGTGVYAGLVQVAGLIAGSDAARHVADTWDPGVLPEPLDPADIAETLWRLHAERTGFEAVVGGPIPA